MCIIITLQVSLPKLRALQPILTQYLLLHDKAVTDLIVSHCTLCKSLSTLLATFTTLVAKVCGTFYTYNFDYKLSTNFKRKPILLSTNFVISA